MNRRAEGTRYEDMAADHLRAEGFTLVTRSWKSRRGEIDLILRNEGTLVFVELRSHGERALARSTRRP